KIPESDRANLRSIRGILVSKIEKLTGGHFVTGGTTHDIYSGIIADTTIEEWENEGYQVDYSGTKPGKDPRFFRMKGYGFYPAEQVVRDTLGKRVELEYLSDENEITVEKQAQEFEQIGTRLVGIVQSDINIVPIIKDPRYRELYRGNKSGIIRGLGVEGIRKVMLESLYHGHTVDEFAPFLNGYTTRTLYFEISKRLGISTEDEMDQVQLGLCSSYNVFESQLRLGSSRPPDESMRQKIAQALGIEYAPLPTISTSLPSSL
ncbi:hypothetical protein KBD71_05075, partial [Candidatus Woesebacteria bacterium]|nr:hypothetical protein [Candidatus Woesebacteria bacterium]